MRHVKFPIQKKLIIAVFMTSALITGVFILGTFLYDYVKENSELDTQIQDIETNNLKPLTKLLWDYNEDQLSTQVESLSHLPQVVHVELENLDNSKKVIFYNPKFRSNVSHNYFKSYDLKYGEKNEVIGRLSIEYNRQYIYDKLYDKALFVIFSQILKSLIITTLLLFIFKIIVSRRLVEISRYINNLKDTKFENINKDQFFTKDDFSHPKYSDEISQISKILVLMAHKTRRLNRLNQKEIEKTRSDLENQKKVSAQIGRLAKIGEMASGVAHEINNPLSVVKSRTEILKRGRGSMSEEQKPSFDKNIDVLEKMIGRMTVITKSLLTMSHSDSAESFTAVDFQDVLSQALILVQEKANRKNVQLEVTSEHFHLYCREIQISQIITNLINNSIDAVSEKDEKWIKVNTRKDYIQGEEFVVISVTDSGKGIPEDIREKLMQPYFTTKAIGKGVGIGLAISKGIAAEHKGSLTLNSDSENTCFELRLPIKQSQSYSIAA